MYRTENAMMTINEHTRLLLFILFVGTQVSCENSETVEAKSKKPEIDVRKTYPSCYIEKRAQVYFRNYQTKDSIYVVVKGDPCYEA